MGCWLNHSIVMYTRWQKKKKALYLSKRLKTQAESNPYLLKKHCSGWGRENTILNEWVAVLVKNNRDAVSADRWWNKSGAGRSTQNPKGEAPVLANLHLTDRDTWPPSANDNGVSFPFQQSIMFHATQLYIIFHYITPFRTQEHPVLQEHCLL